MQNTISRLAYQLEEQWRHGFRPALETFANDPDVLKSNDFALAMAATELELRLKLGEAARIEDYTQQFPSLSLDRASLLLLVRVEFGQRSRRREFLDWVQHYRHRFPTLASELTWPLLESFRPSCLAVKAPIETLPFPMADFELEAQIGHGAFGVVYQARRDDGARIAVKIPYGGEEAFEDDIRKLLKEKRYSEALRHPGIVPVLAGGIDAKTKIPYIAYKLCSSTNLAKQIELGRTFTPVEALNAVAEICDAVEFAHVNKIMHRDLKPANILPDDGGRLLVTDFGLAVRVGGSTVNISEFGPAGTLAYMAPEQLYGGVLKAEAASDLFSLGVILYELLTGQQPFQGSVTMVINGIQHIDPCPPSKLGPGISSDVDRICRKVLSKNPKHRHRSAARLAAELRDAASRC